MVSPVFRHPHARGRANVGQRIMNEKADDERLLDQSTLQYSAAYAY